MAAAVYPESPIISGPLWSPERKGESSRRRRPSVRVAIRDKAHPFVSVHPTPESVRAVLEAASAGSGDTKGKSRQTSQNPGAVLHHALRWAVERSDLELMNWLCSLEEEWAGVLNEVVQELEDEDGWALVGMAIQGSCGHREREAVVRAVVSRWGLNVGPREGRDKAGWTPLHLASIISTPPLISFLLTRGASTAAETDRGLKPFDLVADMPGREEISLLLGNEDPDSTTQDNQRPTSIDSHRREALVKNRSRAALRMARSREREQKAQREAEREEWLREQSKVTAVEAELLLPPKRTSNRRSMDSGSGWVSDEDEESDSVSDDEDDLAGSQIHGAFDDMLVFGPWNVTTLLDILITRYRPHAQPTERRGLPANALHRYARFALAHWDEDCLEMFIGRALERIEHEIYEHDKDLARQAFWAYNTTLLLHLLKSDPALYKAECMPELLRMIEEMISAIHVFVIRLTEQRIDEILGAAILDYEILEEVSDVRFEGEWNLFGRGLTLKKKRDTIPRAMSIFATGSVNGTPEKPSIPSAASIFGSVKESSPFRTPLRQQSTQDLRASARSAGPDTPSTPLATDASIEPTRVTEILSGILLVLQLYEINPAIIVQAFSQAFLWISGELFNRILSRKQYLCRSKAVQITMNITVLNDWVRANGLPAKTSTKHLEPLSQLLQWLQCLSGISDFDTLIITMQNMKALNPLQLRRAVRDYKYEVGEGRMTDECTQYLVQLQKDWEKRRNQLGASHMRQASMGTDIDRAAVSIDSLLDGSTFLADWTPQAAPECLGELLDNRFMIPFVLPSDPDYLVAMPPFDIAFRSLAIASPFITDDSSASSRPASRSSWSSARPLGFRLPSPRGIRRLPKDFFAWLKDKEAESRLRRDDRPPRSIIQTGAIVSGSPPTTSEAAQPAVIMTSGLAKVTEETIRSPISSSTSQPLYRASFPSPGLATSNSMAELRSQARQQVHSSSFEPVNPIRHKRTESYELKERPIPPRQGSYSATGANGDSPTPSRIIDNAPLVSPTGTTSGSSMKKWWNRNGAGSQGRRDGSEDTVMEDLSTPTGHRQGAATADEQFWSR